MPGRIIPLYPSGDARRDYRTLAEAINLLVKLDSEGDGWTLDSVFSASDLDTVAWTSGTFTTAKGSTYAIGSGNTGNMAARTYIYLDIGASLIALQTSTTITDAIGPGRVFVGVAENGAVNPFYQIFGGIGGFGGVGALSFSDLTGSASALQAGIEIVGALPTLADAAYPVGSVVFLTTDGKLYRNIADVWVTAVATVDLTGTIALGTQVSGTLTTSFAAAGLINSNVTINADGSLTGAGAGQASLTSLPGSVQIGSIAANAVTATEIAALAVTTAKLDANAVTAAKIFANTITAAEIAANTITANEILGGTITAAEIAATTITGAQISALSISGKSLIADTGTVGGWTMAAGSLSTTNFRINSTAEEIEIGSATAPLTGDGIWMGQDGADYEFRCGDPAGAYLHYDGTELTIVYADGSSPGWSAPSTFTPTWSATGFSTDPTGDLSYAVSLDGLWAKMWATADRTGTSDAGSMAITNLPAAIRPVGASVQYVGDSTVGLDNTSDRIQVGLRIFEASHGSAGTCEFLVLVESGSAAPSVFNNNGFTTSGTKGLIKGSELVWAL